MVSLTFKEQIVKYKPLEKKNNNRIEESSAQLRMLHNEELSDLYTSPNIVQLRLSGMSHHIKY
jgi:hypothetical protein